AGVAWLACAAELGWLRKPILEGLSGLLASEAQPVKSVPASTRSSQSYLELNPIRLPRGGHFPLADLTPQPVGTYNPKQVTAMLPAFKHVPFDKGGFSAIDLPFRYSDPSSLGNADEANAFAFLLSNALDWAPGCYCSRHAYFVFKRSMEELEPMREEYNHGVIAAHVP